MKEQENRKWLVKLEKVLKIFNKKVWTLRNISLTIYEGEGIALIGPNDAGKSILARVISSEISINGGLIEYNFDDPNLLKNIGYQFGPIWPEGFKVKEILDMYIDIFNVKDEAWVDNLLDIFKVKKVLNKNLTTNKVDWLWSFSLLLAFLHKPKLVVITNISFSLGVDYKLEIINFLKKYQKIYNATFVFTSPQDSIINSLCNRIITLNNGTLFKDEEIKLENGDLFNGEKYYLKILDEIEKAKSLVEVPDPNLKPIIFKFNNFKYKFAKDIVELAKKLESCPEKLIKEEQLTLLELKNIHNSINQISIALENLSFSIYSKYYVAEVRHQVERSQNTIKRFNKIYKKYKKINTSNYELIRELHYKYYDYLLDWEQQLKFIFSTKCFLNYNYEYLKYSKEDKKKLRELKRKYISEEKEMYRLNKKDLVNNARK